VSLRHVVEDVSLSLPPLWFSQVAIETAEFVVLQLCRLGVDAAIAFAAAVTARMEDAADTLNQLPLVLHLPTADRAVARFTLHPCMLPAAQLSELCVIRVHLRMADATGETFNVIELREFIISGLHRLVCVLPALAASMVKQSGAVALAVHLPLTLEHRPLAASAHAADEAGGMIEFLISRGLHVAHQHGLKAELAGLTQLSIMQSAVRSTVMVRELGVDDQLRTDGAVEMLRMIVAAQSLNGRTGDELMTFSA
jgi:hypothetical protein